MKELKKISVFDLPDTVMIPDGYDMKSVPDITQRNITYIIKEHNNLVDIVNLLLKNGQALGS